MGPILALQMRCWHESSTLSESITLLVGKDKAPKIAHKNVLCNTSPFFDAACKPQWMNPEKSVIKLEDDPIVIQVCGLLDVL